jgi:hypothetical protein
MTTLFSMRQVVVVVVVVVVVDIIYPDPSLFE